MLQDLLEAPIELLVRGSVLYVYFDVEPMHVVLQVGHIVLQVGHVVLQVGYVLPDASLQAVECISGHLSVILSVHVFEYIRRSDRSQQRNRMCLGTSIPTRFL